MAVTSERTLALYALTATVLVWGFTSTAVRFLVISLDPGDLLVVRYMICAPLFLATLAWIGDWRIDPRHWPRFVGCGLLGVAGYNIFNNFGMQTTPASLGGLILGTEPVFIAAFAAMAERRMPRAAVIAGLALASAGTLVLIGGDLAVAVSGAFDLFGALLVLGSAIAWSAYVVMVRPLLLRYGAIKSSAIASLCGTPPLLALGGGDVLQAAAAFTVSQWGALLFLALLGTTLATFSWNYGNRHVSSAQAGAFIYAIPLVSVVAGMVVLGERLSLVTAIGGAMILAGVAIAQFTPQLRAKAG